MSGRIGPDTRVLELVPGDTVITVINKVNKYMAEYGYMFVQDSNRSTGNIYRFHFRRFEVKT